MYAEAEAARLVAAAQGPRADGEQHYADAYGRSGGAARPQPT